MTAPVPPAASTAAALEGRLIDLEIRITHHERMAEELSQVVAAQDRTISLLTRRMQALVDKLRGLEGGWTPSPQDERPPPHY